MSISAKNFFTGDQQDAIKQAIMNAELDTSGEIRVHIENTCKGDVMNRAAYIFEKIDMHKTLLRNGVLIYLAIENRKFAIIGDKGINAVVPGNFWDTIKMGMLNRFRENQFTEGLCESISQIGILLKTKFPRLTDDINELPDEISFGKE